MNKKILILLILPFVIAASSYFLIFNKSDNKELSSVEPTISDTNTDENQASVQNDEIQAGKYIDYKSELLASTKGIKILFFHASWCSICKELDQSIKDGKIPDNVIIFKTDYDSNQKLRQQYGVTIQTTLVLLDDNNQLVKKFVAAEEPTLEAIIENLL